MDIKNSPMPNFTHNTPFGKLVITGEYSSDRITTDVLGATHYNTLISDEIFLVSFGEFPTPPKSYRNSQFSKGLHLGHHLGPTGNVASSPDEIKLFLKNGSEQQYREVFWKYALKYYLSVKSFAHQSLHIKATTLIDPSGNATMLIGRGGAGKSTLASCLKNQGYETLSNTHTIFKNGQVWGLNTWVRTRTGDSQHYAPPSLAPSRGAATLTKLIVYDKRNDGQFFCTPLSAHQVINFFMQFGLATCNYDLKEDLSDTFASDIHYLRKSEAEYALTIEMLNNVSLSYLSADAFNPVSFNKILTHLGE